MYMTNGGQPFGAGHESAGVTAPALSWFLAEGATGAFFDMFVLIANPDPTQHGDGAGDLPARQRHDADQDLRGGAVEPAHDLRRRRAVPTGRPRLLANAAVSTILTSTNNVPIVVERAMWWPGGAQGPWYEGHNSPGATTTGTVWALAEGEVGGSSGASTYILVANTGAAAGQRPRDGLRRGRRHGTSAPSRVPAVEPLQRRRRDASSDRRSPTRAWARWSRAWARRRRRSSSSARCTRTPAAASGRPARTPWRRGSSRRAAAFSAAATGSRRARRSASAPAIASAGSTRAAC